MAYDMKLADRVREYLADNEARSVTEKRMFGGLAFMVNDKMCVNVSGDRLMCRFAPERMEELSLRPGFSPMIMKNKEYKGYGYVDRVGYQANIDFEFWMNLCLDFNQRAKSSKSPKGR